MTRDDILNMPAGREMDALIEKLVFCHAPYLDSLDIWRVAVDENMERVLPKYSTDIAAAWEVVEKFDRTSWDVNIYSQTESDVPTWEVALYEYFENGVGRIGKAEADTAPLAICRAALLAVMDGGQ